MSEKYLIAGLGNPGVRYAVTRHNVGFMVVDRLAERLNVGFRAGKGDYVIASSIQGMEMATDLLLLKPLTYMNNSGMAVRHAADYFRIDLARVLIVYDDFQLPLGKLRLRPGGSDGGHQGMASVIGHLGTEEVPRLRVGIGNQFEKGEMVDYVLSLFSKEEQEQLPATLDRAAEAVLGFAQDGIERAMSRFN